jgi:hypothetical protein
MSIYQKLSDARKDFHSRQLKKSGKNNFAGYSYFELSDFLIPGLDCMSKHGLVPVISFGEELAIMTIHDVDSNDSIAITSPMSTAALKGCHEVQNLGAVQTYLRRYLWMAALEIIEHDAVDASGQAANPKPKQPKADAKLLDQLVTKVDESGRDMTKLLAYYSAEVVTDLTDDQAQQALAMLA